MKPDKVNILGIEYSIIYVDNPAEVDSHKRESLWGQVDFWTQTIRIYNNGSNGDSVHQTLMHEILHCISCSLNLVLMNDKYHDDLDILAACLCDTLKRNGWLNWKN